MIDFNNRLVITGFGAVGQTLLPLLQQHLRIAPDRITIIDFADRSASLQPWLGPNGVRFIQQRVTPANLGQVLSSAVNRGGLIIDLAWSINFFDIAQWAHDNQVLYVNSSIESWDPGGDWNGAKILDRAMYPRYVRVLELARQWTGATTAVVDHGANPGLISAFAKKALIEIGQRFVRDAETPPGQRQRIEQLLGDESFALLAKELGVKAIHCSEFDTQTGSKPRADSEFLGTWSIEGMWEESVAPCEIGWGTHERAAPGGSILPEAGPRNVIVLPRMGMNTWVRSWLPDREFVGMAIAHGEIFGLSRFLTVQRETGVEYRPTVLYAYSPCAESFLSLHELRHRRYEMPRSRRIMTVDIASGADAIGALIMGHKYQSWWTGSVVTIGQARQLVPTANATTVQVAAGVLAGVLWAIENPKKGLCLPEDLPYDQVLRTAQPFLGRIVSGAAGWTPLRNYCAIFAESPAPVFEDPWQFGNFVFRP